MSPESTPSREPRLGALAALVTGVVAATGLCVTSYLAEDVRTVRLRNQHEPERPMLDPIRDLRIEVARPDRVGDPTRAGRPS